MKRRASGSTLFMMELILVILFFSLCAAICMQVFATARLGSDYSRALSVAVAGAESAAECYKAADGDIDAAAELLGASKTGNRLEKTLDDGSAVALDDVGDGSALITVTGGDGRLLYSLTVRTAGGERQ